MQDNKFTFSANPVSSAIRSMAYSGEDGSLVLIMGSGAVLFYLNVPKRKAVEMLGAESVGSYYNKEIRNKYRYLRVGTQEHLEVPAKHEKSGEVEVGNRNNTLHKLGTEMYKKGSTVKQVRQALIEENLKFLAPLPASEVEDVITSLSKGQLFSEEKDSHEFAIGGRNSILHKIAGDMLIQQAPIESIKSAMEERNNHFQDPLSRTEVEAILNHVMKAKSFSGV